MLIPVCFPTPLPDETIYSVLCRYHVRSCNATDNATILQLFGKRRSLQTTVLSAFPLKHTDNWIDSFHGISVESLITKNTAMPFYRSFKVRSNSSCSSYASDRFFMNMYNKCCTPTKKIRYCPKCAKAQWDTFGVAYWQVLPQINGYEICHIHNEPIRETSVSHKDIRFKFYPASNVLSCDDQPEDTQRIQKIYDHWDDFLQLSNDINFLYRFSYPSFLLSEKIRNILIHNLLPVRKRWYVFVMNDPVLYHCEDMSENRFTEQYLYNLISDISILINKFQYLSVHLQMSICRKMFGDIRKVCRA